ncbi:RNA polymerase sigma factor [Actinoplanes sp. SE50]|uniref:SigE family RNA polymerase sigma factor n=1 Tax=unclassified Actinoplanes TaxID=2626549 RepID=UPI00023EC528|nr:MULTISPECIES: SigE family RNA polymerase sigma factor [unclassified Actinoplanes]AEV88043.1 RNA polymerase sigma-E factor [Actinoplanes sp. SE50/110]ATO86447.1 RNA polymerase sigma factor [Actinoplanes sp. SE50]SLM03862.1 RNA polymerase sigma factor [Actinoplanes sp. SE50/110]
MRADRGSGNTERDSQFAGFVAEQRGRMVYTARLLTAGDAFLAEDLVQTALTKLYVSWAAFGRADSPDAYVRRALFNALVDERKRIWRRHERPVADVPDRAGELVGADDGDPELARALGELPPRMRAAVVFRFVHDMDVAETARALGCSAGTVKSQTARALDKLRAALGQPALATTFSGQPQGAS